MDPDKFPVNASVMAILPSRPSSTQMDPEHRYTMASLQDIATVGAYSTILPVPSTMPLDRSSVRRSPDEEEMEDTEESPDWAVRVGDAPPPAWGKRKASDDERDASKKGRLHR